MKTEQQIQEEITKLSQMRDEDIDTSDIPEVKDWSNAVVGKFFHPKKDQKEGNPSC